ncbi:Spo0B domain-containing protein [Paenibacillus flagellatus]|uniref:SpoOB alpha-helical domain-containing protein n=1 Tax=Paenibacillus flagellatus TaxID=2211139 RepID=A0A2V5JZG3_9BACL|nr:Spo0B domain-containing protein [Paenibacillus flagellatus]PYI52258.1 hypothetical protein DLM86_22590 [Paenibacillus flagellatus]
MKPNARRYESDRNEERDAERDELFVQTLNHIRHDWLNDIQVLYGYLKLKKYDKLHDYVDTIKEKMIRESAISKLGVPSLIVYLQSFRVRSRSVRLDVELEPAFQLTSLPVDAEAVSDTIIAVIETLLRHVAVPADGDVNRLRLAMSAEEDRVVIGFDYAGGYDDAGLRRDLGETMRASVAGHRIANGATYNEGGAAFYIYVPLGG